MARQKVVNGVYSDLTAEEEAALEAQAEAADLDLSDSRVRRNCMLFQSDWTQVADAPLSAEKVAEWATYRQELRDLFETYTRVSELTTTDPDTNVVTSNWPTPPE